MRSTVSKTKKKSRSTSKKKSPSRHSPLLPAFMFLIVVGGLITTLYYLYIGPSPLILRPHHESAVGPTNTVSQPKSEPVTRKKLNQLPPRATTRSALPTTLKFYRLEQNFSQPVSLRKSFNHTLNRQQKAQEIIHLLTLSKTHDLAPLPHQTRLLAASFTSSLITINLSKDLTRGAVNFGGRDEMLTISCLTNSFLENFPGYNALQILIEGEKRETLAGHIDISQPLHYQPSIKE